MVVCERAKLATGVRFSSAAPSLCVSLLPSFPSSRISGEERGLQNRASGSDSRPALQVCAAFDVLRGAGRQPDRSRSGLCSHQLAARLPDSRSDHAGSSPAGNATPRRLPPGLAGGNSLLVLRNRATRYERGVRGSTPRRETSSRGDRLFSRVGRRSQGPGGRARLPLTSGRDASLRSSSVRVRLPAEVPRGGSIEGQLVIMHGSDSSFSG